MIEVWSSYLVLEGAMGHFAMGRGDTLRWDYGTDRILCDGTMGHFEMGRWNGQDTLRWHDGTLCDGTMGRIGRFGIGR